ncbi:sigma-54 dependent transcriptional regulator, partial [Bacteroides sp. OttesenSCG-928-D19]|nr:sigma-54 dependent transcriptional regulator [Bacteroides sp. OttesenSCG-928-D19]
EPYVAIDLGSIPENLFESELFGYEKGAFTDARKEKAGRMEVASGGTLFLNEIGNLPFQVQAKLLSVIEQRTLTRLGSTKERSIDVRLISATNSNIYKEVDEGGFRQDLLYRINTIEIHLPPLRERGTDITLLSDYFLNKYATKYNKDISGFSKDARLLLKQYPWPGNVRELQHAIERAVIMSETNRLQYDDFMLRIPSRRETSGRPNYNLEELERNTILEAIRKSSGNLTHAAELLGITRTSLYRRIEKYGI